MWNLQGSIVALITPFDDKGRVDFLSLSRLVDFHLQNGTDAILYNGTTGESPTITDEEFEKIGNYIVHLTGGQIPVIAGVGGNVTSKVIDKILIAEQIGVDGFLVVSPAYNKPTRKGLLSYYSDIARSTDLPVIMYNVPGRTASSIPVDVIIELSNRYDNITGIKEASGDLERMMSLINMTDSKFKVFSGDDSLALSAIALGADGCISVVANQIPKEFSQMIKYALRGELYEARKLHYQYLELMRSNFIETNPIPVKTALYLMGYCELTFRSPLCEMEYQNQEKIGNLLHQLELVNPKVNSVRI